MSDEKFMKRAIKLAEKGRGKTSPNPMVGAVLVKDGQVISEGFHEAAGKTHAEAIALKEAGEKAKNATLYVTLEPCCILGRTPPCVDAIISAGVAEVVTGLIDPNPKVSGKGVKRLQMAGIKVETGLLAADVAKQNETYVCFMSFNRPFISLKVAASLDGKTATSGGESKWITGEKSRSKVHQMRNEYDAVVVGIGTILKDNPLLTVRVGKREIKNPVRVVVDTEGKIPFSAQVVSTARDVPTVIATTERASMEKMKTLQDMGVSVIVVPSKNGHVDLEQLLKKLAEREITNVLVEGGASLNAAFFEAGLVDKIVVFYAPKVIGGQGSPGIVGGEGVKKLADACNFEVSRIERIGEDIMVVAYPKKTG